MQELKTVARLYTQAGRRRASVLAGPGEPLVLKEEADRRYAQALEEIEGLRRFYEAREAEAHQLSEHIIKPRKEALTLRNQRDELRIVLDKRPAINAGLIEAYTQWSGLVYAMDWLQALDGATAIGLQGDGE